MTERFMRKARHTLGLPIDHVPAEHGERRDRTGLWLSMPAWMLIIAVAVIPIAVTVYLSFTNECLVHPGQTRVIGLDNYLNYVLAEPFLRAFGVTAVIAVGGLLLQVPLGIGLALLLERPFRGLRAVRSALLVPMMLTPVAVGLMWQLLLNPDIGVVGYFLEAVGLPNVNWLAQPNGALASIVLVSTWQNMPFVMLMFLAGLSSVPREPLEAARIDGGSGWQVLRFVTLPMLAPVVLVVILIRSIDAAKLFDLIYILTEGGPGRATQSLSVLTYSTSFQYFQLGRGAAIAIGMMVILSPLYILWKRVVRT